MQRERLATIVTGFTILAAVVAITAWPEASPETESRETGLRIVRVAPITVGEGVDTIHLAGVTRSTHRAELAFSLPAKLVGRPVEVGDRVRAGQVLAVLDDREYRLAARAAEASVAELEIRLAQSERDRARVQQLVDAKAATLEELERTRAAGQALQAALDAVQARAAEARRLLDEAVLRSPFPGVVTSVAVEPGEWVGPGVPVVEISGDGSVEVAVDVPESVYGRLSVGQPVAVELPFVDRVAEGTVTRIANASAGPGRLFPVEVTLKAASGLVAGLTADIVFTLDAPPDLTLPLRAVVNPGSSQPTVFRIADARAHEVPVELGRVRGDRIEVVADLAAGEMVAVAGHTGLRDGDRVEVR